MLSPPRNKSSTLTIIICSDKTIGIDCAGSGISSGD